MFRGGGRGDRRAFLYVAWAGSRATSRSLFYLSPGSQEAEGARAFVTRRLAGRFGKTPVRPAVPLPPSFRTCPPRSDGPCCAGWMDRYGTDNAMPSSVVAATVGSDGSMSCSLESLPSVRFCLSQSTYVEVAGYGESVLLIRPRGRCPSGLIDPLHPPPKSGLVDEQDCSFGY